MVSFPIFLIIFRIETLKKQSANADCFFNNIEMILSHARPFHNKPISVDFVSIDTPPLKYNRHMWGKTKMNGHF
ncbi:hypothetical protein BS1321_05430 [Peribacillus simplex NBRC 15720 = DSM 1321]|uniref:Uncharacterized protein n=1 Tax=Peribacillus simplex NBRC 15720 = DSM 1321 TaxID=1349754 RepID=A0A223EDZ1_9BACI|nr:hypothetical protein BS1321_05430 [Peribacillus simplex NBRC 15720 = DSM 1321]